MTNVIVAFSKPEDAKSIKNVLIRNGFSVIAVCTSGAQVLNCADGLSNGIVVSGYRLMDMIYEELHDFLPNGFDMLLLSSPNRWSDSMPSDLVCLSMPLKAQDLVDTVQMMAQTQHRLRKKSRAQPQSRSFEDQELIDRAKDLLMERNSMTETEAHRYIQKCSMDSGTNLVETAQMIMSLMDL